MKILNLAYRYTMNQLMSESVQAAVRPHECVDTYYSTKENSEVQCLPATVENRFVQALTSLQSGATSTLTFNPQGGLGDIVLSAVLPVPVAASVDVSAGQGLGLTRGWLYQMIQSVNVRYAGSQQYQFGGEQMLMQVLNECEDSIKKDQMLALGGAEIASPSDWAQLSLRSASIYIKLPHNSPSAQEKPLPFPTDVISGPVQIQIQFKSFSQVFLANDISGVVTLPQIQATIPAAFASAQVQYKQVHLNDRADSASVRHDLSKQALSIPLRNFMQYQFTATLPAQDTPEYAINLTGFRSGSVQGLVVFFAPSSNLTDVGAKQPLLFSPPKALQLSVNGLVYYRSENNSDQIWSLCERKTSATFSTTALTWNAATRAYDKGTGVAGYWAVIPFAQVNEVLAGEYKLMNGLGIGNSVVNLTIDTGLPNTSCQLFCYALYNATLLATGGSCDYVF